MPKPKNTDAKGVPAPAAPHQEEVQVAPPPPRVNATTPSTPSARQDTPFTFQDLTKLSDNEHQRYFRNSPRVAHALIKKEADGSISALQYQLPPGQNSATPAIHQLTQFEEIIRFGMKRYRALGADGTTWYAKRYEHARVKWSDDSDDEEAESVDFAYFSEEEAPGKEPFWGSNKKVPRIKEHLSDATRRDLEAEEADMGTLTKGGHEMRPDAASIQYRDAIVTRNPDQNTVMGESARDAYEHLFSAMEDELSPEFIVILKRAFQANLRKAPENQYRPEWLHLYGFSLTPASEDPQKKNNLGAAGRWANTEMMVLERIAKWFVLNQGNRTRTTIKTLFSMFRDSELVETIHFEVNIEMKNRFIRFIQDLDVFSKYPIFRKASDLAQATGIAYAILHGAEPLSRQRVKTPGSLSKIPASITANTQSKQAVAPRVDEASAAPPPKTATASATSSLGLELEESPAKRAKPMKTKHHGQPSLFSGDKTMPKSKFPTHLKNERSIVQVLVTSHDPDYDQPWNGTNIQSCSGTGIVIEHEGEHFVLTNAHCVSNQIRIQIRLANDRQMKFDALPVCVSYQSDLALLRVSNPKFKKGTSPAELGEMVGLHDEVFTIGFPMGGDEISVTRGIVSRIEVGGYAMSGLDMLQVQVDAAINPGNSGGPVYSEGKVIGVAFQGYNVGQNLGYLIPMPIVKHFLKEVFSGNPYRGFPILPVDLKTLENRAQRKFYGMTKEMTGMLISDIDPLCDAHEKLKAGDVLLEIDGYKISNQGTVDIPEIGNCIDLLHITHMKMIGDRVRLKILRKDASGTPQILDIKVTLDRVPLESRVVPQTEYDKMPTYYVNSGLVFVPVSRNYLDGPGSDLDETAIIDPIHGTCRLSELPKKFPGQQLVAINTVLDCKSTEGYEGYAHTLIKTVNGKAINNLADLIEAMESYQGETHLIVTSGGSTIALKKLSDEHLKKVMSRHKISFDRSEDLRPDARAALDASVEESDSDDSDEEMAQTLASAKPKTKIERQTRHVPKMIPMLEHDDEEDDEDFGSDTAVNSYSESESDSHSNKAQISAPKHKRKHILESDQEESDNDDDIESSSDSDSEEEVQQPVKKRARLTHAKIETHPARIVGMDTSTQRSILDAKGPTPGQQRFMQTLGGMERRYKDMDDDALVDFDNLTDDDEEQTAASAPRYNTRGSKKSDQAEHRSLASTASLAAQGLFSSKAKARVRPALDSEVEPTAAPAPKRA